VNAASSLGGYREAVRWVIVIVLLLSAVAFAFEVARGRVPLRDDRGKLRPSIAVFFIGITLSVLGLIINALD
jgi:hypothetical protein